MPSTHTQYCVQYYKCTVCVLMFTSGVAVTPSNVLRTAREVEKWWGRRGLRYRLYIPESKEEEIRQNFPDEMDQKKQSMTYWINTDPLASWRRLIRALDRMEETKVADSIRSNAEPLTGNHTFIIIIVYLWSRYTRTVLQ